MDTLALKPIQRTALRRKVKPTADRRFRNKHLGLLETLGWQKIPNALLRIIADDLDAWATELQLNAQNIDRSIHLRRSTVRYWIKAYMNECCSLKTAIQSLS